MVPFPHRCYIYRRNDAIFPLAPSVAPDGQCATECAVQVSYHFANGCRTSYLRSLCISASGRGLLMFDPIEPSRSAADAQTSTGNAPVRQQEPTTECSARKQTLERASFEFSKASQANPGPTSHVPSQMGGGKSLTTMQPACLLLG